MYTYMHIPPFSSFVARVLTLRLQTGVTDERDICLLLGYACHEYFANMSMLVSLADN